MMHHTTAVQFSGLEGVARDYASFLVVRGSLVPRPSRVFNVTRRKHCNIENAGWPGPGDEASTGCQIAKKFNQGVKVHRRTGAGLAACWEL